MKCFSKWLSATLVVGLVASAAMIAAGGNAPIPDGAPSAPSTPLSSAQDQPASPPVVTQDPLVVFCCGGGPVETLVVATDVSTGTAVAAKEKPPGGGEPKPKSIACPDPEFFSKTDKGPKATPFIADFIKVPAGQIEPNFGGTKINKHFRHTFYWDRNKEKCCQCVSGALTLHVKAIGEISVNDRWSIQSNGKELQGGFIKDMPKSGMIQLNAAALDALCCTHRLSIQVQDDHSVLSASLQAAACCVKKCK